MPRPTRIEYQGAFHHVMNRGQDRRPVFKEDEDYQTFLATLQEASKEYSAIIHAYCLMTNHYHLLIETPKANLSQIMKHINGLYTQRYNRKYKKDGPLFRGRYKSVLVDEDAYLLQLTRYIHRNPSEVKNKIVDELSDYPWSSYPSYINQSKGESWLYREKTYQMLGHRHRYKGYRDYVEKGIDEDIKRFYSKGNILSVLGDKEFRTERKEENQQVNHEALRKALEDKPSIDEVIQLVCRVTNQPKASLLRRQNGRQKARPYRAFAMYCCHQYSQGQHKDIAKVFELTHHGSVSGSLTKIRQEIRQGSWFKEIERIESEVFIM